MPKTGMGGASESTMNPLTAIYIALGSLAKANSWSHFTQETSKQIIFFSPFPYELKVKSPEKSV